MGSSFGVNSNVDERLNRTAGVKQENGEGGIRTLVKLP